MSETFVKFLTETEERQLFRTVAHVDDLYAKRDWAWMMLMRHTGIRVTPMSCLTVRDAEDALALDRLTIRGEINKRGKQQIVPLNRHARQALQLLLRIRRDLGHYRDPDGCLVMSREKHKGLSVRSYQHRLKHWCFAAGLGLQVTPHWFRHTLAKRIIARSTADNPLQIAQRALGHADINTTTVYTQPDREDIVRAMREAAA